MAGKVKKGFGTYLFIFFLAGIAAIMITLLVMMFKPFKEIAGYQYFYYNYTGDKAIVARNVTGGDTSETFDLSAMTEIKVNCNYADVRLYRSSSVDEGLVRIENTAKGFASADADVDFSYKLYYEDAAKKILCIDVDEPNGGVYFSKYVKINIVLPESNPTNLSNTTINVANTSGDIEIGFGDSGEAEIEVAGINVKTNSGDIRFGNLLCTEMKNVFVKSGKGNVSAINDIKATNSFSVISRKGNVKFQSITTSSLIEAKLKLASTNFHAKNMKGIFDLEISDGYFTVDKLQGEISGNNAAEQMSSARITIDEVVGNVSFPFANKAKIKLGTITDGKIYVHGTSGSVRVDELNGYGWIEMTSGSVNVKTYEDIQVKTTSGHITVKYLGNGIDDKIELISKSGSVNLHLADDIGFILSIYEANGEIRNAYDITIEGFGSNFSFPLVVNSGTKPINVYTGGSVDVDFE